MVYVKTGRPVGRPPKKNKQGFQPGVSGNPGGLKGGTKTIAKRTAENLCLKALPDIVDRLIKMVTGTQKIPWHVRYKATELIIEIAHGKHTQDHSGSADEGGSSSGNNQVIILKPGQTMSQGIDQISEYIGVGKESNEGDGTIVLLPANGFEVILGKDGKPVAHSSTEESIEELTDIEKEPSTEISADDLKNLTDDELVEFAVKLRKEALNG